MRSLGLLAGLLGGLCWVARWLADGMGGTPGWSAPLHGAGLGLLGLALAAVGAGLVSRSVLWLRVFVAVAFPLLVWSLYSVVRGDGADLALDGSIGVVAVVLSVLSVVAVVAGRRTATSAVPPDGRHGSHAAR